MPRLDETRPFLPVNIALLTVSDTRDAAQDRSGSGINSRLRANADALDRNSNFCGNQTAKVAEVGPVAAARCQ